MTFNSFDEILENKRKGSLKIIMGYAAGVGKTYSMLREAHSLKERGFDIVIGYLEPHKRADTQNLAVGLEVVPLKKLSFGEATFYEMDTQAIIARAPQIVLVDELAHTNVEGSKNNKRYMDVMEILDAQINVITTLNVQHLESVADKVAQSVKISIHERIPDKILQIAQQIVMADVTMEDLRERLRLGKIYEKSRAETALVNFFTYHNLAYLRELCLREVAGNQFQKLEENDLREQKENVAEESVMIALSSDPTNAANLIRKGAKIAARMSSRLHVIYIQKKSESPTSIDSQVQRILQQNLDLAIQLGAEVKIIKSQHIADCLVNYALENKIKHAVFGKSRLSPTRERIRGSILLEFIHDAVGVDVHVINIESGD